MWVFGHFIVTQLIRNTFITINEIPPFWVFCIPPYFAHDASCVMLNIDWTPLQTDRRQTELRQQRPEHNVVTFG